MDVRAQTLRSVEQATLALHDPTLDSPDVVALLEALVETLGFGASARFSTTAMADLAAPAGAETLPVRAPDGTVIGLLSFEPSSPESGTHVAVLAGHAGVALDARRRLAEMSHREESVRRIAEQLQDALLPPLPDLANTDTARRYEPAVRDARVGGDFYDVFGLPDGRTLIVVGDIVGKGIEAASRTSQITQTLRALALQGFDLGELLHRCDEQVAFQDPEMMATVWCGLYDDATGELAFCSMGHPPALLLRASGSGGATAIRLELQGLPLGMRDLGDGSTDCRSRQLDAGDLLVLYTDGVVEAAGDYLAGQDALLRAVEAHRDASLDELCRAAMGELLADANHFDDALMLLLRRK